MNQQVPCCLDFMSPFNCVFIQNIFKNFSNLVSTLPPSILFQIPSNEAVFIILHLPSSHGAHQHLHCANRIVHCPFASVSFCLFAHLAELTSQVLGAGKCFPNWLPEWLTSPALSHTFFQAFLLAFLATDSGSFHGSSPVSNSTLPR